MDELQVLENGLVPVYTTSTGEKVVDGRELWQSLESGTRFNDWIKRRFEDCEAVEMADYQVLLKNEENLKGGRPTTEYIIKLSIAKEMAMLERNEKGKQVRKYFISVEEKFNEAHLALNALSPQLQLLISMELKQAEMEKQLAIATEKVTTVENAITNIKETIITHDVDWRKWVNDMFNKAVMSSEHKDFQSLRQLSYEELESRARCRLNIQLNNLKTRLYEQGATKSKIDKVSRLDVIEADVRLKEIYTSIIKELSIRYAS